MRTLAHRQAHAQATAPGRIVSGPDLRRATAQRPAIRQILGRGAIQPQLRIGAPDDVFEREADRVADQVMAVSATRDLGPAPAMPSRSPTGTVQRRCTECEGKLDRKERDGQAPIAAAAAESSIRSARGSGAPLPASERRFFAPRFGRSFDDVRIHDDLPAHEAARSINARAFTLGSDITFAEGEYRPESREGKRLLAHELTHVLQQSRSSLELSAPAAARGEGRLNVTAGRPEIRRQGPKNPIKRTFGRWVTVHDVVPQTFAWPNDICSQTGHPIFEWAVDFATSLETGYIVQRIENVFDAENCDGTPFTGAVPTPLYWERWYVENHKMQTDKDSRYRANDAWVRNLCNPVAPFIVGCDPYPQATRGNWSMTGTLYILPDTSNPGRFYHPNRDVPDAGNLEATLNDPGATLGRPKGSRTASGSWDCCP